jgi:Fe-S-cluster containining protein
VPTIGQLIDELLSNEGYATGRRSFPRTVTPNEAADIAEVAHAEVSRGTEARDQQARRVGTHTRKGILCAFNGPDGECMIHPIRPWLCRTGHAVGTPDYCGLDHPSGELPSRLEYAPLDTFKDKVSQLERALHNALGRPKWRPESICVAVHRLLTAGT